MAAIDDLKNLLSLDIHQLDSLVDVLQKEKSCLSGSDAKALETLTREKNALLGEIRERAKQKIRTLVAMGFRPDSGEPSRFIRSAGLDDLYTLWQKADEKLRECHTLNQNNGRIINHLQKRLTRLTDIFRGASGQQKLYGAKGQQTTVSSRTVLASA
ncbi:MULTISPECIES: flagella synthesis protein FlgN [unclassified Marinobacter]|uniref:flagella synthesis protein FlgN n=1 Tax=unclassified Marinobacter TaxID=83889 RepID=UPI0026E402C9|nr:MULTISPECIES: flagellar protein FlgN [unclassified Marinobacter]MDO6442181.1 flagellar protein FlgN [Marinobacter sp. 2_MG-2023]MDO6825053.1 flagellar protein FlgN [Marinobacter sp. 1_MG-2023]